MADSLHQNALFEDLVFNQVGEPVPVDWVGGQPFYVVLDAGFRRYVEAEEIDKQVLAWLHEQIVSNQDLVTQGTMSLLGRDDLFTKAMIDASIQDMDKYVERARQQGMPVEARAWLGMLGFRVVVNVHGEVTTIETPSVVDTDEP